MSKSPRSYTSPQALFATTSTDGGKRFNTSLALGESQRIDLRIMKQHMEMAYRAKEKDENGGSGAKPRLNWKKLSVATAKEYMNGNGKDWKNLRGSPPSSGQRDGSLANYGYSDHALRN